MNTRIGMPEPTTDVVVEPTRSQLWSNRGIKPLAGAVLVIAVLAATVGITLWTQGETANHLGSVPASVETKVQVDKKGDFSFTMMYIDEPGKDVRIVSVNPLTSSNVQFLGASTIWPRTKPFGMQGRGPGYPPEGAVDLHPAAQAIPASETSFVEASRRTPDSITVLAGFRLLSGDIGAFNGVELTYIADGKTVRQYYDYAALLCHTQTACSAPQGSGDRWPERVLRDFGLVY